MLIPCDEVNILNTFRVMVILRLLLLLTNLHLKLLSTQGTGADKLLSTQRVNVFFFWYRTTHCIYRRLGVETDYIHFFTKMCYVHFPSVKQPYFACKNPLHPISS